MNARHDSCFSLISLLRLSLSLSLSLSLTSIPPTVSFQEKLLGFFTYAVCIG
jgi:hypothetical protein